MGATAQLQKHQSERLFRILPGFFGLETTRFLRFLVTHRGGTTFGARFAPRT
jgi:hypothetical protein